MKIRPSREWLHVELLPPKEASLVFQVKGPAFRAGVVRAVGPACHGVAEGDVVVFPKEHMTLHKTGKALAYHLQGGDAETSSFMVKWYDCLFVLQDGQTVEIEGFSYP